MPSCKARRTASKRSRVTRSGVPDEHGVRGIRPATVDPRRGVGENEVSRPNGAVGRHAASRRRRVRPRRHRQDARHALPGLPKHLRRCKAGELRLADARRGVILDRLLDDVGETTGTPDRGEIGRRSRAPRRRRPASYRSASSHSATRCGRCLASTPVTLRAKPAASSADASAVRSSPAGSGRRVKS